MNLLYTRRGKKTAPTQSQVPKCGLVDQVSSMTSDDFTVITSSSQEYIECQMYLTFYIKNDVRD